MDEARHDAVLRVEENENPEGGEEIRRQIASADGRALPPANVARKVEYRESPAHNALKNAEPEEFLRRTLLLPKWLLHQIVPPAFTVTPPLFRPGGKTGFLPRIHYLDRLANFAGRKAFFAFGFEALVMNRARSLICSAPPGNASLLKLNPTSP